MRDIHSLSQQRKDMNPKDDDVDEGKICRKTFLSHSTRNKHMQNYVCHKSLSRTSVSSRNSPPPNLPAILLQEDLLMGHTCPYTILPSATAPYRAGYEHFIDFFMIKMYHLCLHLSKSFMNNNCPSLLTVLKVILNHALKRHAERCEIKSS